MPPELGPSFPADWPGHPPHMSALDFRLWQRLRADAPLPWPRLYFDVAVGSTAPSLPSDAANLGPMWKRLTAFRIDVVGDDDDGWTLVELRQDAGPGAIGSLLCYRDLWLADPPDARPVSLLLVTNQLPAELQPTLGKLPARLLVI